MSREECARRHTTDAAKKRSGRGTSEAGSTQPISGVKLRAGSKVLARLLELLLPTRPGERRLTFALLFHNLFAVGSFLTGRTVRDALFLTHADKDTLAWMYVASAVAVTITGLLYTP